MAEPRHWFDPSQPQTLQGAVMLCYLTAAFSILWILFGAYPLVVSLGLGAAGYGLITAASACLKSDHLDQAKRYCLGLA